MKKSRLLNDLSQSPSWIQILSSLLTPVFKLFGLDTARLSQTADQILYGDQGVTQFQQQQFTQSLTGIFGLQSSPQIESSLGSGFLNKISAPFNGGAALAQPSVSDAFAYKKFVDHLKHREGVRNDVYYDSKGKLTVGVGHLVKPEDHLKFGQKISNERIESFLNKDARHAWNMAEKQCREMGVTSKDFKIALASVNFQMGSGWTQKFHTTWPMIKNGDYVAAAENLEKSQWNRETPVRVDDFQNALKRLACETEAPVIALQGYAQKFAPSAA